MRDPELTKRARAMRKEMTEPALRLWLRLRAKRFAAVKFRREKVIEVDGFRCIADFASNDPKLVIEVDGDTHDEDDPRDAWRTRKLEELGYRVVRYTNRDVISNMEGVLEHLALVIEEVRRPPLPTLSPEGERAILGATGSLSPPGERGTRK
jgi:very-short-patch-repair endonuclease